jgi:hypothetical protein
MCVTDLNLAGVYYFIPEYFPNNSSASGQQNTNFAEQKKESFIFNNNKPIGASPRCDYVVRRMVLVRIE